MAARLGLRLNGYDPYQGMDMEEAHYVQSANTYPEAPQLSMEEWASIQDYIISLAPDSLEVDTLRRKRLTALTQFQPRPISVDKMPAGLITALHFDTLSQAWWTGNRSGEWFSLQEDSSQLLQIFGSPISGFDHRNGETLILEMGYMNPSDVPRGKLWLLKDGKRQVVAESLFRPVYAKIVDVDQDGKHEYLVCEFGNRTGRLTLWQWDGTRFSGRPLLQMPGTICVQEADMDQDGKKDLVILTGQGEEGIYILYNREDGSFAGRQAIRLPPIYGSSWFELFDYEGDGDLDIAIVNGDNADYTYALKPYHGLRLFLNNGRQQFEEAFFYPIYGATRLAAHDFDRDGDIDFAVTALFPDYTHNPNESFVYLENQAAASYRFQASTGHFAVEGQWMVMDVGDFEQDGDLDIILGAYDVSPAEAPEHLRRKWASGNVDLLLLENQKELSVEISNPPDTDN